MIYAVIMTDVSLVVLGRCKQRAQIGLEIFFGDNRDDTHMLQMIKAKDVIQHILRKQVETSWVLW